ncbi:MAG TPA: glycosyltransferase family 87 protein [Candidatus Limnocylindrales bacterium]|nr:glycosyltransferase family 87 protein [Candidatus Limnocylindrales bacterium]
MIVRGVWVHLLLGAAMAVVVIGINAPEGGLDPFPEYAERIVTGGIPYRDYPFEYPPLALFPLAMPRLLAGANDYIPAFAVLSFVFAVATTIAVGLVARRGWSGAGNGTTAETGLVFGGLALAALPLILFRFDIFAAMFAALALLAVAFRRPGWVGAALGFGALVKIFPAFLLPVVFLYYVFNRERTAAVHLVAGFVVSTAAVLAEVAIYAGPRQTLAWLTYQDRRGVEIESIHGSLAMLGDVLGGPASTITFGFGSYEVTSALLDPLGVPLLLLGVTLVVGVIAGALASFRHDVRRLGRVQVSTLVTYLTATVLLIIVTNKVLSPQYMVWLFPFAPLLRLRHSLTLLVAQLLTTIEYPLAFADLRALDPKLVWLVNLRNAILIGLLIWLIVPGLALLRPRRGQTQGQSVAMLEMPPRSPAETPNMSNPMASRLRCGAIRVRSSAAKVTVATLARVRPGRPSSLAR